MSRFTAFRRVSLPQVWRIALPGLGNIFLVILKETALVSVIGVEELMRKTEFAVGFTKAPFTFFLFAAFIYLGLTVVSMGVLRSSNAAPTAATRR
jgi:putative lysine/arginine/ornithine/histidine/octopine transport system permease protein